VLWVCFATPPSTSAALCQLAPKQIQKMKLQPTPHRVNVVQATVRFRLGCTVTPTSTHVRNLVHVPKDLWPIQTNANVVLNDVQQD
jgi:hypothetical protein